jgi:outer membrane immunogenic protein
MFRKLSVFSASLAALCSGAIAADLPAAPPPVTYSAPYGWTGLYLGANIGFGGDRFVYPFSAAAVGGGAAFGGSVSITSEGVLGGGQHQDSDCEDGVSLRQSWDTHCI